MIKDERREPPPAASAEAPHAAVQPAAAAQRLRVRQPLWPALAATLVLLLAVIILAATLGPVGVPLSTVWRILLARTLGVHVGSWTAGAEAIVWQIRLPRVVLAGLVGATLSCSGATYQGVFRNPLAEPYLIGVASGAGFGAALAIVSGIHGYWHGIGPLPAFAFLGAMTAMALSYGSARSGGSVPLTTLILAGVAISLLASAGMSFLFMLHNDKFLTIFSWLLGGFNTATWQNCLLILPYVALSAAVSLACSRLLNVLQVGEEQAKQLGVPVERVKVTLLITASLGAAAAVSVSGLIGFVGLVVPHGVRLIWGPDYRRVVPLSIVLGAVFLILADLLARMVMRPQEVPIGVITAFCGAPFFLFLLKRKQRSLV